MFKPKRKTETDIQELIDSAQTQLFSLEADTKEYDEVLKQIERLYKLKSHETETRRVSPDTILLVVGNLAGIALILSYEHAYPVVSKALGFIKPKV